MYRARAAQWCSSQSFRLFLPPPVSTARRLILRLKITSSRSPSRQASRMRRVDRLQLVFDEPVASADGLLVRSAGNQVGGFAHIFVEWASTPRSTSAATTSSPLRPLARCSTLPPSDTSGERNWSPQRGGQTSSTRWPAWLNAWPDGTVVTGAVADDASVQLSREELAAEAQALVDALARYGVAGDLRWSPALEPCFRWHGRQRAGRGRRGTVAAGAGDGRQRGAAGRVAAALGQRGGRCALCKREL